MSYIIASLPPLKCFVRREYFYNFTNAHGELEPAIWLSIKALRGQVFRIESLLPNYGALYDKLPLHAYVWREDFYDDDNDNEVDLPIDYLQLWDCMGYHFTVLEKIGLRNLGRGSTLSLAGFPSPAPRQSRAQLRPPGGCPRPCGRWS